MLSCDPPPFPARPTPNPTLTPHSFTRFPKQIFYATIGASANVGLVVRTAPVLFLFSALALAAHLGLLLGVGKLMGFSRRELLLASNANIGGGAAPTKLCAWGCVWCHWAVKGVHVCGMGPFVA